MIRLCLGHSSQKCLGSAVKHVFIGFQDCSWSCGFVAIVGTGLQCLVQSRAGMPGSSIRNSSVGSSSIGSSIGEKCIVAAALSSAASETAGRVYGGVVLFDSG